MRKHLLATLIPLLTHLLNSEAEAAEAAAAPAESEIFRLRMAELEAAEMEAQRRHVLALHEAEMDRQEAEHGHTERLDRAARRAASAALKVQVFHALAPLVEPFISLLLLSPSAPDAPDGDGDDMPPGPASAAP